jgi:ssDNA-binding replication factor A large subunit
MKIEELEPNSKVVSLVGAIMHLDEPTESTTGIKVQEGVLSDKTGQVKLSLWGDDQVGKFEVGEKVLISTGWCKEFKEDLQVSTGKFGKITKVPI